MTEKAVGDVGDMRAVLERIIPDELIQDFKGRGNKPFDYIDQTVVFDMLNEATGGEWSFELEWPPLVVDTYKSTRKDNQGNVIGGGEAVPTLVVGGHLTVPGLGRRGALGVTTIEPGNGEDNLKAAGTDAFKKAATLFGVFMQAYRDTKPKTGNRQQRPAQQQGSYQQSQPQGASGSPQYSERQGAMFDTLIKKYQLNGAVIAQEVAGYPLDRLNSSGMSKVLTALAKIDREGAEIPPHWHLNHEGVAVPPPAAPVGEDIGQPPELSRDEKRAKAREAIQSAETVAYLQKVLRRIEENGFQSDTALMDVFRAKMQRLALMEIATAATSQVLDGMFEVLEAAGLGQDPELLSAMSAREEQLERGGDTAVERPREPIAVEG